jgi:hypothetical protein
MAPVTYEAESRINAVRLGTARVASMTGASGGLGVFGIGEPNGGILHFQDVAAPATRTFALTIFFQNPDPTPRPVQITVNEGTPISLTVAPTGSCCVVPRTIRVTLLAGSFNTIEFGDPDARAPAVDRIVVADP